MLFEAGRYREDVGIEDDVRRIESRLVDEQPVGALTDGHFPRNGIGLTGLVERHDDDAGAVAMDRARLLKKVFFAFLQADGIDNALSLNALQAGFEHGPLRAVDDDRDPCDLRLGRDVVEEGRHGLLRIEHALVHVDVDQVRAASHLIRRDPRGFGVVAGLDEAREPRRARDVRPLANHLKVAVGADGQDFQTRELSEAVVRDPGSGIRRALGLIGSRITDHGSRLQPAPRRQRPGRNAADRFSNRPDVIRRRPAAAADDVDEAARGKIPEQRGGLVGTFVVLTERIGQTGVWITQDIALGKARQLGQIGAHVAGAERAVDADRERLCVPD